MLTVRTELFRNLFQVAGALFPRLRRKISWYAWALAPASAPSSPGTILTSLLPDLFTTSSYYNLVFKILFISSQGYILSLMLSSYKPTNAPNLDAFGVEYLLGAAA